MSGDQAAQTHNVHVVVLYPLMSEEEIRDQCRPHAGYLVGRNTSPYPGAADGQAPAAPPLATARARGTTKSG